MRRLLGAFSAVVCVLGFASAADQPTRSLESLIDQLGDPSFARREAASRELASFGHAALPALDKAAGTSQDAEVRHRASAVAASLRRTADSSKHIATKLVKLDYNRVPLGTAVSDLKAKTGVPLALDQARVADPLRIITVKTDELPAWEAIDAFCNQTGLKEVFRHDLTPPGTPANSPYNRRRVYYDAAPPVTETAGQIPVLLADGKQSLPGDRTTSVRVLALPANFPGNKVVRGTGTVVLNLDVTPLGGLKWDDTTAVRVFKAEDETGRPVTVSYRTESRPNVSPYGDDMVFMGGGQVWINGWDGEMYPANPGRLNPRVVPITLKTDDRSITMLKVLEGAVVGEITLTNQTLASVANLSKATGRTVQSGEMSLTVNEYKALPNGRVTVKMRVETPNQWAMQRQFGVRRLGGGRTGPTDGGIAVANGAVLKFADADGKALPTPMMRNSNISDDGVTQSWDYELEFAKRDGYGAPTTLTAIGNKAMTVEVPFRLKNVPLP